MKIGGFLFYSYESRIFVDFLGDGVFRTVYFFGCLCLSRFILFAATSCDNSVVERSLRKWEVVSSSFAHFIAIYEDVNMGGDCTFAKRSSSRSKNHKFLSDMILIHYQLVMSQYGCKILDGK